MQVRGREAKLAAAGIPVHDIPGYRESATQQHLGNIERAGGQCRADPRTADPDAVGRTLIVHDLHLKSRFFALAAKYGGITLAVAAKAKVFADDNGLGAETAHEYPVDEFHGGHSRQSRIERQTQSPAASVACELSQLIPEVTEAWRRIRRPEVLAWMRLECHHGKRSRARVRKPGAESQQRLVSKVDAIKVAEHHDAGSIVAGQVMQAADQFHYLRRTGWSR